MSQYVSQKSDVTLKQSKRERQPYWTPCVFLINEKKIECYSQNFLLGLTYPLSGRRGEGGVTPRGLIFFTTPCHLELNWNQQVERTQLNISALTKLDFELPVNCTKP